MMHCLLENRELGGSSFRILFLMLTKQLVLNGLVMTLQLLLLIRNGGGNLGALRVMETGIITILKLERAIGQI